ncbi:cupin domain-containing protein [Chloroflexota bacterium]
MNNRPYITYSNKGNPAEVQQIGRIVKTCYINEPGQVSFGVIDYAPNWFIALHHHHTWELIIIDTASAGSGYTFFDGHWWRAEPGSGVFIPRGYPHAWCSGNNEGFKMLWIYGGAHDEAGCIYNVDPDTFQPITQEEEHSALIWMGHGCK